MKTCLPAGDARPGGATPLTSFIGNSCTSAITRWFENDKDTGIVELTVKVADLPGLATKIDDACPDGGCFGIAFTLPDESLERVPHRS